MKNVYWPRIVNKDRYQLSEKGRRRIFSLGHPMVLKIELVEVALSRLQRDQPNVGASGYSTYIGVNASHITLLMALLTQGRLSVRYHKRTADLI